MRRRSEKRLITAFIVAVVLALPLPAAAGTGQSGRDASGSPAAADIRGARSHGVPFSALDLALLGGGTILIVGLGSGMRRLVRERP